LEEDSNQLTEEVSKFLTIGADVAAFPAGFLAPSAAGNLSLTSIPAGANILQATLYANNYFDATRTPSATFAGNPLGSTTAYGIDAGFSTYRWDVKPFVAGNGNYAASYTGMTNSYGLALAVVYSDQSLPFQKVAINDGAIDPLGGIRSTTFNTFGAGLGTVWLHTGVDNNGGLQSAEQILFNGAVVGVPIDANIGNFASLFQIRVNTVNGLNTLDINNPNQDQFGWDLAVLVGPAAGVPEPGTLALLGLGLVGLAAYNRQQRK
jgi:hypothetical protein